MKPQTKKILQAFGDLPADAFVDGEVVDYLRGSSRDTRQRDIAKGIFPAPVKVGVSNRWRVGDVRAWLRSVGQ